MAIETRSSPARAAAGSMVNPAANLAKEQIFAKQVFQWTLEGKCFTASVPVQTDSISGQTAYDDEAQTFILTSDTGGSKVVIPITTVISLTASTGTLTQYFSVCLIAAQLQTDVKRTLTGTGMNITNNRLDLYGNHTASALYTATSSALDGKRDWTRIDHYACDEDTYIDVSNGMRANTVFINHLQHSAPLALYEGGSLAVLASGATTAPTFRVIFQWAELDASDYLSF